MHHTNYADFLKIFLRCSHRTFHEYKLLQFIKIEYANYSSCIITIIKGDQQQKYVIRNVSGQAVLHIGLAHYTQLPVTRNVSGQAVLHIGLAHYTQLPVIFTLRLVHSDLCTMIYR